ncbi:hypothetical protein V1264_012294 [Littorina saxatilis]|uniref:Endonuclease-reverse transcriptase n=1 Tax=Littorina saxatilis TaxID=31220 RepID=A0AAN9BX58_9CAEN
MTLNILNPSPIQVDGTDLPTTEAFTYLGSIVRDDGGAGNDIKSRLTNARNTFRVLNNVWRSSKYSSTTKLRLYQSCVLSILLYGSECWKMTESDLTKLSTFHTKSLRRILRRIFWPNTISNQQLLAQCNQKSMETIVTRRRWKWIGHVLQRQQDNITRTALHWTPEGKRKRRRPKNTWRRTVEGELQTLNQTWGRRYDPNKMSKCNFRRDCLAYLAQTTADIGTTFHLHRCKVTSAGANQKRP